MAVPKELYPSGEIALEDIETHLDADCIGKETRSYYRPITDEELQARREQMPTLDIQVSDLKDEAKAKAEEFKGRIKPLEAEKKQMLTEVRSRQVQERGMTYAIPFYKDKKIGEYNRFGQLISERSMTPEERQQKLSF